MNSVSLLIKTDPKVKKEAQAIAKELGLSLSSIITGLLKEFNKTKTITFTTEELTPYAKAEIKKAMKNLEEGKASPIFDNTEDMFKWIDKQEV